MLRMPERFGFTSISIDVPELGWSVWDGVSSEQEHGSAICIFS